MAVLPRKVYSERTDEPLNPSVFDGTGWDGSGPIGGFARGETEAMFRLASMYRTGQGVFRRLDDSARLFADAAERGHLRAMYMLAQCYERVIGVGIVGPGAGEMIAEAVLAVELGATARDLAESIHAHPTLAEAMMEVSFKSLGRSLHG